MVTNDPLFPCYLFIRLGMGDTAKSWAPICSTKGDSRMVSFRIKHAWVGGGLIGALRAQEASVRSEPERLFKCGDRAREVLFAGNEGMQESLAVPKFRFNQGIAELLKP